MKNKALLVLLVPTLLSMVGCNKQEKEYFKLWNDCKAIRELKAYVEEVTKEGSDKFIPVEDRIATFDMDGTFVAELYPTYFEYLLLEYRGLDDPTYTNKDQEVVDAAQAIRDHVREGKDYPSTEQYKFDLIHAHAAAKAYKDMTIKQFDTYVKDFAKKYANGFDGLTYLNSTYKPMLEVFDYLKDNGFTYYVVSGSDRYICRALTDGLFEPNRVIGMDVALKSTDLGDNNPVYYTMQPEEDLIRTDELLIKNLKLNKVRQISQEIGKAPVLSFGNSDGDCAMHNYCLGNKSYKTAAFMLVADDDARDHAKKYGETDAAFNQRINTLKESWTTSKYTVISMKDDFKTIYGDGVTKTNFIYK